MRAFMRSLSALAALAALLASGGRPHAQLSQPPAIQPRALPPVTRQYEDRLNAVRSGNPPPTFHGSASVMPTRAQSAVASLGIAGVPQPQGHFCGAVAIDPHWLVTAAHCVATPPAANGSANVRPMEPSKFQILIGTNTLNAGDHTMPIERIVIHPSYRVTEAGVPVNDLALLRAADTLPGPPFPIATDALARIAIRPGDRVGIAGWGTATFSADSPISINLLLATVEVVDRAKCNEVYRGAVTGQMFCAGLGSADSCQGDSGGPAWAYDDQGAPSLIGIVSWGAGCTRKRYPGVYVDVTEYREWIDATIGRQRAAQ